MNIRSIAIGFLVLALAGTAAAQQPDVAALLARQRTAMQALAFVDGTWRGSAKVYLPGGAVHELVQTERVGPMLDGSIKVIEGRAYGAEGRVEFNAFAIVSFDVKSGRYRMHSHAQGGSGDFEFEPRPDGFVWRMVYGPVTIRHTAVVKDGRWSELTERLSEGQPPVKMVEMDLRRVGDTDWPAAGAVPMRDKP
jgi:hypothetical protein